MERALRLLWQINDLPGTCLTGDDVHFWKAEVLERLLELGFLRQLEPAQEVKCLSCDSRHWDEIITLPPGKDGKPRHYIPCPENLRERVPEYRLNRYGLNLEGIARFLHRSLSCRGEPQEMVPGRVWSLGRLSLAGKFRSLALAHGLTWRDRQELITRCSLFVQPTQVVTLVTGRVPYPGTMDPAPPWVTLSSLLVVEETSIEIDRDLLEEAARQLSGTPEPRPIKPIILQPHTRWDDLFLHVSECHLWVIEGDRRHRRTLEEAGFTYLRSEEHTSELQSH